MALDRSSRREALLAERLSREDAMAPSNVIVDLSHHNGAVDLGRARDAGIVGIIHKATQGESFADAAYAGNRKKAADAGLLWGAYHFGSGGDGVTQADFFLGVAAPDEETLLVLDLEDNPQGPSMDLDTARAFVARVAEQTGRFPGLYSGHYIKTLLGTSKDPVLAKCWFWLAQYGPTAVVPPNWERWTMWQYTDGVLGAEPRRVDGIGACDRNTFDGDEATLRAFWTAPAIA
jgi:lysozyme